LTALSELLSEFEIGKTLIIAPLRVANSTWSDEIKTWDHVDLDYVISTGTLDKRLASIKSEKELYIINRENIPWLVKYYGKKWPFDTVVIDESTSFKSPQSKRFKMLKSVLPRISRMIELTATPSPNGLLDLWAQIYLLDQGYRLGKTMSSYKAKYFTSDYMGYSWTIKPWAEKAILDAISDIVLTMKSEDYITLPPLIYTDVKVELTRKDQSIYCELEKEFVAEINSTEVTVATAAALANKLLQFCNGAVYYNDGHNYEVIHNLKLDALEELLETNPGENFLVAYNYKSDLIRLQERFPDAVLMDKKGECIDPWNRGEIKMMLAHPASAGHGLNLQAGGSIVVWFGLNWSLEYYQQFNGRLYRQGQTKPVTIAHIVCSGCIDERVMEVINDKSITQDGLINFLKRVDNSNT
jgi:SNF2 family DNA or RNA helicase